MKPAQVHVAVGVLVKPNGEILIAKRPQNVHQGGLWEFPGGKLEQGESTTTALSRELKEELNIDCQSFSPIIKIAHDYTDKSVLLDVQRVTNFNGEPCGNEGQPIRWVMPKDLHQYAFPVANHAIIRALTLPDRLLITGQYKNLEDFSERLTKCLAHGIALVQLRAHALNNEDYAQCVKIAESLCESFHARLVLNRIGLVPTKNTAHGRHLSAAELMAMDETTGEAMAKIQANTLLGASCHNKEEILKANAIGVDYICLSPVQPTASHTDAVPLNWSGFAQLALLAKMPVYALGGMSESDITTAQHAGAQGVAAIREWWNA